jgi:hypothetical protein
LRTGGCKSKTSEHSRTNNGGWLKRSHSITPYLRFSCACVSRAGSRNRQA